jgi:hypothetical protein
VYNKCRRLVLQPAPMVRRWWSEGRPAPMVGRSAGGGRPAPMALVLQPMVGRWSPTSADARLRLARDCASHRKPDLRQCATQRCGSSAAAGRVARWRAFSSPSRSKRGEQITTGELIVPPGAAAAAGARQHGRMHGGCRRCFYAAVGLRVYAGRSIHAGLRDTTTATCRMHGGCRRRHERAPRKVSAAQSVTSRRVKSARPSGA